MPDIAIDVVGAEPVEYSAVPSIGFKLHIQNRGEEPVAALALASQIRILANQRPYSADEKARLWEVFGPPELWGPTMQSVLWTNAFAQIGAFDRETDAELTALCTYDFEVATAKYFDGVRNGAAPLEFLFSGTIFRKSSSGLMASRIPWDRESRYSMPVEVWRRTMDRYFPDSAWLRVGRRTFDRLYAYRMSLGAADWDSALDRLLGAERAGNDSR